MICWHRSRRRQPQNNGYALCVHLNILQLLSHSLSAAANDPHSKFGWPDALLHIGHCFASSSRRSSTGFQPRGNLLSEIGIASHGSAFAAQARWPEEHVEVIGKFSEWSQSGDSGGRTTYRFCSQCGSTVAYFSDGMPGVIAIPIRAFADPTFPSPRFSVYEERKHRCFAWSPRSPITTARACSTMPSRISRPILATITSATPPTMC
jgi:hypothetical protein